MIYTPCVGYVSVTKKRTQPEDVHGIVTMEITHSNIISGSPDPRLKTSVFNAIFSEEFISPKRFGNDTILSLAWLKLFPRGSHAHVLTNMRGTTNGSSYKNYRV